MFVTTYADIYKPQKTWNYKHVVIFFDLDKVILNESGGLGKIWAALTTIPLSKSLPILFHHRKRLMQLIKEARYDGQKLKGLKANLDCIIEAEPSLQSYRSKLINRLNEVSPRIHMIRFLNTLHILGYPLMIATNNDYESLCIKMRKLNKQLRKQNIRPFICDACFCAGSCPELLDINAPNRAGFVYGGKDTDAYFSQFFDFVEDQFGYKKNETLFIYIDDLDKNIERARQVAEREKVQLYGVHRNKSDKKIISELRTLFLNIKTT